jgi:hypothetical protein
MPVSRALVRSVFGRQGEPGSLRRPQVGALHSVIGYWSSGLTEPVTSIPELHHQGLDYRAAIPVLLDWLPKITNRIVQETIVRVLSVPWAKPDAARPLIRLFIDLDDDPQPAPRWAIGNALEVVADDQVSDDLIDLAADRRYGTTRRMIVLASARPGIRALSRFCSTCSTTTASPDRPSKPWAHCTHPESALPSNPSPPTPKPGSAKKYAKPSPKYPTKPEPPERRARYRAHPVHELATIADAPRPPGTLELSRREKEGACNAQASSFRFGAVEATLVVAAEDAQGRFSGNGHSGLVATGAGRDRIAAGRG